MFKELYKNSMVVKGTQEERRQAFLEKQKEGRQHLQDLQRSLDEMIPNHQQLKASKNCNWKHKQEEKFKKTFRSIFDQGLSLQQSEWLRDIPGNMCEWLLVPCPKGQRCLVVAHKQQTSIYNKFGRCVCVFRSMLPGDSNDTDNFSILDCVYVREQNAFYVLDVLAFGEIHNLLDCEAEFRFFWLRSKWEEFDVLTKRSARNQKSFHLIKVYDFENISAVSEAFQKFPLWVDNKPELDGFLFYHRYSHYTCGTTPLVGWLFAFMVPDVLNMQVHENYSRPEKYLGALSYMDYFDKRIKHKQQHYRSIEEQRTKRNENAFSQCVSADSEGSPSSVLDDESLLELIEDQRYLEMQTNA